jgi:multiple sugar transport system ATP-binding protein
VAAVEYRELSKVFPDGTVAVDRVTLDVEDGEFLVLVGPSGSGKTTVLRMTAGLEEASAGEIRIGSDVVNELRPRDRDIAMVFQNYALYPHMSVYDNMAFGLRLHKHGKAEIGTRVRHAADMLGISELLNRKPAQLSGGQRQRVAMGRAIVREPAAFLMDEPLSNLDAKLRVEMRGYISLLHQRLATTTLYVTHDQTEAMTMGSRVAVMRDGRVEQTSTPQELYSRPRNLFVASFIGSPAMNLIRSRLTAEGDDVFAAFGPTRFRIPRAVLADRPGLRRYVDRDIALGVRPEGFEDAALGGYHEATFDAHVSLAEPLGSEVIAHFDVAGVSPLGRESVAAARRPEGEAAGEPVVPATSDRAEARLTARLDPHTSVQTGSDVMLAVDVEHMYYFDLETEEAVF